MKVQAIATAVAALLVSGNLACMAAESDSIPVQDAVALEIGRLEDAWAAAEVRKDGAAVEQLLAADFLFTDPEGKLHTRPQFIQLVTGNKSQRLSQANSDFRVKVYGNTAVIHGIVTLVDKVGDGTRQTRLRWTDTWVKQADGKWRCVAAQSAVIK